MNSSKGRRRGQANVISLMILVAATLTIALALYGYFASIYAQQGARQSLYDIYSQYTNNINLYVEVYLTSNISNEYQYCTMISVVNRAGDPLRLYLTILPVGTSVGGLSIDNSIIATPVDYTGPAPTRKLYAWLVEDANGDGIVEMLDGVNTIEFNNIMSCADLYDHYAANNLNGLPLPSDVDVDNIGYFASNVTVFLEDSSFLDIARARVGGIPDNLAIPMWNITLQPFEKKSLYFFMTSPVEPNQLSVVGAFKNPIDGKYLIFTVQSIKK